MGILDEVKSLASTIQKIDNIELYRQILDLQGEVLKVVEENASLRKQVADLSEKMRISGELRFDRDVYWVDDAGPYCTRCWDTTKQLVRLLKCGNPAFSQCPTCKYPIKLNPELD